MPMSYRVCVCVYGTCMCMRPHYVCACMCVHVHSTCVCVCGMAFVCVWCVCVWNVYGMCVRPQFLCVCVCVCPQYLCVLAQVVMHVLFLKQDFYTSSSSTGCPDRSLT